MPRYQFFIDIHALPSAPLARGQFELGGQLLDTLVVHSGMASEPFPVSFEEACAGLDELEQILIEPDGSFVWSGQDDGARWQVDGVLYDRAGKLIYVELKGACPSERLDQLLSIFGWPATPLMFQLVREATFLDEANFRCHASAVRADR